MNTLRYGLGCALVGAFLLTVAGAGNVVWAQGQQMSFSVTGDVPYGSSEVSKFQTQMTNHNKYSPSKLFVHVGDILSGGSSCSESVYSTMASSMKTLEVPAFIVPGDNETVDCKSPSSGFNYFMKYFDKFEKNFCAPTVERQSGRSQNWAFMMDGVLFIGVDMVYGSSAAKQAADWVTNQLQNHGSQVRAAVVFSHFSPSTSSTFSTPFRKAAGTFGKPVLFVHGHGHSWSTSYPFSEKNIFRVQVNKGGSEDPVEVTVTMNTSSPATAFILKRKPWSSKTLVSRPPCGNNTLPAPDAPSDLVATLNGSSTISLAWADKANNEDGFKIERKAGSDNFSEIATVGANVTTYDNTGLAGGVTFTYRVRAHRSNSAYSAYTNESSATTTGNGGGTSGSANLALNQPVSASSTDSDKPETNAVDGDAKTYWRSGSVSSSNPLASFRVDLGAAMTVGQAVVTWKDNYYAKTFEVQISNDDANWTSVASANGGSGTQTLSFTPTTAQYVRLYFTSKNKSNYRIIEFQVYSGSPAAAKRSEEAVVESNMPTEYVLEQNYPNPFNPSTQIRFGLPEASRVSLKVYDINGAEVATLVDAAFASGIHTIVFNAGHLSTGTYFYVMQAGAVRQVRRLMLVK